MMLLRFCSEYESYGHGRPCSFLWMTNRVYSLLQFLTHHIFIAEWGPQTGVRESLLLNGGLCAFASVGNCDGSGHSSVKHVHRGGDLDVVAVEKEIESQQ